MSRRAFLYLGKKSRIHLAAGLIGNRIRGSDIYPLFAEPDEPFFFAGEHISNMTGWQEGAYPVRVFHDLKACRTLKLPLPKPGRPKHIGSFSGYARNSSSLSLRHYRRYRRALTELYNPCRGCRWSVGDDAGYVKTQVRRYDLPFSGTASRPSSWFSAAPRVSEAAAYHRLAEHT